MARLGGPRRALVTGAALVVALAPLLSCSSDADEPPEPVDRTADVYEGIVRWAAAAFPPAEPDDEGVPVVFVVTVDGGPLDAGEQAEIVRDVKDEADVRFADQRDEVIDADAEDEPVREEGVLLLVGAVAEGTAPVDVDVEVYRSLVDDRRMRFSLSLRSEEWTVTSVVEL